MTEQIRETMTQKARLLYSFLMFVFMLVLAVIRILAAFHIIAVVIVGLFEKGFDGAEEAELLVSLLFADQFLGQNGMVSQPRIYASFVSKATGEFAPCATFNLEFMVSSMARETDKEGVELDPPRLKVQGIVPQYTAPSASVMNVDLVTLVATSPSVIDAIENYWQAGECFKASGRLNFSSRTEEVLQEVDFGEAQKSYRTINVNEFVITGGSQAPLDGDLAWELNDIKAGMAARKARLEEKKTSPNTAKKTPVQHGTKGALDLGF